MNKEAFLKELEAGLSAWGIEDREAYREYFGEIFEDMQEEGLTEEEAAARLGNPREIAEALAAELGQTGEEKNMPGEDPGKGGAYTQYHTDFTGGLDGLEKLKDLEKLKGLKGLSGLSGLNGLGRMINDIVKNAVKAGGAGSWSGSWTSGGANFSDYDITLSPQGVRSLEVIWLDGDVEVRAADRPDILLGESRSAEAEPLYTELRGDSLIIAYTETFAGQAGGSGIRSGWERGKGKDLQIELPHFLAAQLQQLKIRTTSGDLELKGIKARSIDLNTASGDMEGHDLQAEEMHIVCVSGDTELELQAQRLFAKSVSGDMDLTISKSPESLTLQSVSGDIDVRLPQGSACRLQHHSVSGDVHVRGLAVNVPGAPEYSFRTVSGDINIRGF